MFLVLVYTVYLGLRHLRFCTEMERCFAMRDRVVFMDIYVDPEEHVYPMHIATGSMKDMILSKTEQT